MDTVADRDLARLRSVTGKELPYTLADLQLEELRATYPDGPYLSIADYYAYHRVLTYDVPAALPSNEGEYAQLPNVLNLNRFDTNGRNIEASMVFDINIPITIESDGGSDTFVTPLVEFSGNYISIQGAGTNDIHDISGLLTIRDHRGLA
jgi:hypothetical protein